MIHAILMFPLPKIIKDLNDVYKKSFSCPSSFKKGFETGESWLPGCDKGTWENKKDGGAFVEEFETPVIDADLRGRNNDASLWKNPIRVFRLGPKEHHSVQLWIRKGACHSNKMVPDM